MIRQAISCDICGTEMLNANHWFVAYDRGPELRIGAWNAHNRAKGSARHLCGHKCLHKFVDNFMARTLNAPVPASVGADAKSFLDHAAPPAGTSLTRIAPHKIQALPIIGSNVEEFESSAHLIKPTEQITPPAASGTSARRAEAWRRERQRQAEQAALPRRSIA